MDKGAHFSKCDFQVHTPRDINWAGDRPITEPTRKLYAEDFVRKCRELGLNAVAITDHHDFGFFPFLKDAANAEIDSAGQPVNEEDKLIVFPGLELTLSTPSCQAILIIDADYPINSLNQILHLLAINPTAPEDATTVSTVAISNTNVNGFEELYDKLNTIEALRGKFIVLPNLSEGGRHTLLRAGNSEHYRKMPCVGGYVDGAVTQFGTGNSNIVNGIAREYGYKSVAVFQTSDNRQRDFGVLGRHSTWVKWAVPTAEALRQACLAKESRLTHNIPELPQIFITKIDVTNSRFLGSFSFEFNQQYSALIGGRGTGKSTILEYLRWALCDQTEENYTQEEKSEIEKRRFALIEKTLVPYDGEVRITFSVNGVLHFVKRNSVSKEILLKIGNGEFQLANEGEVRKLLPIQAYSQKQLSSVGIRTEELKRFIQQPIANLLGNLKFQLSDNAKMTKRHYNDFVRIQELQKEIELINLEVKSLNDQVTYLRSTLSGISEEDQKIISDKRTIDLEQNAIYQEVEELETLQSKIDDLDEALDKYPATFILPTETNNTALLALITSARDRKISEVREGVKKLKNTLEAENLQEFLGLIEQWDNIKLQFEQNYEQAKAKTSSNQTQLREIERLEKELFDLTKTLNARNLVLKELGNPEAELEKLRVEWFSHHQKKVELLNEQSAKFSNLSNGFIKAETTKSIDIRQIKLQITSAFQGARINESKVQAICDYILTIDNPLSGWKLILDELKKLAEHKNSHDTGNGFPDTPILKECDFNDNNLRKVAEVLSTDNWINMATTEIEFSPEFKYTTNSEMDDSIPFAEASAGQQATALLTVLLNQTGGPLIIDQPEDDIDNRAIEEIIKNIWDAKKQRQLIFTSHNANLVVNGDAELVICCDYRDTGSQTRGLIKVEGAIDSKNVRDEITSVMEGGEKAFKLRKDKYGF